MPDTRPDHLIRTREALLGRYGVASKRSRSKVEFSLSVTHRAWLARSAFLVICSADETSLDCSPRGDAPGAAFAILDDGRIAIPDRRGNNRLDTLTRLVDDPRVALLFLVRDEPTVLRVAGQASISIDPAQLTRFTLDGVAPATVILVEVQTVLMQNTRAVQRAQLWTS